MATVINKGLSRAGLLGQQVGASFEKGFGMGFEAERTKQENEEKAVRLNAMLESLNESGKATGRDALSLAVQNPDLFDGDQGKMIEFAKFYESTIQSGGKASTLEINVDGENKTVLVTDEQKKSIALVPDSAAEVLNLPLGSTVFIGSRDPEEMTKLFDKSGKFLKSVPTDDLDSGAFKLKESEFTQDGLKNLIASGTLAVKQSKEKREAAKDTGDLEPKGDLETTAFGELGRAGIDKPTKMQVRKEVSILRASKKFSDRIARSLGAKINDKGIIERFEKQGDEDRYDAAVIALPELMRAGMSNTRAFLAAKRISQSLEVGKDNKAQRPIRAVKAEILQDEKFIKKTVVGQVFKVVQDGRTVFFVATGKKEQPYISIEL